MGADRAVPELLAELDQITRLFHQLRDVPPEVRDLFNLLRNSRQNLSLALTHLSKRDGLLSQNEVASGAALDRFRLRLLDLEAFLNPNGQLHQSGPRSYVRHAVPWPAMNTDYVWEFCQTFEPHVLRLDTDCRTLISLLASPQNVEMTDVDAQNNSPTPSSAPSYSPGVAATSGRSTPGSMTRKSRGSKYGRVEAEEQKIMKKFIEQYYPSSAGAKRKRPGAQASAPPSPMGGLDALAQNLPFPPSGLGTLSPLKLTPHLDGKDAPFDFNEFRDALPSFPWAPSTNQALSANQAPSAISRGKQRALHMSDVASIATFSSSSSGSTRSLPLSRDASLYTVESKNRTFETGTTKLWHAQSSKMIQLGIEHIEVRRFDRTAGEAIQIICRTETGLEVTDDLWMDSAGQNSSPFLENKEVIQNTFLQRDKNAKFVVRFAPNPKIHPQYSFSTKEDCYDFMQAIVDKTLCASIDVDSIKSACTHGNAVESGCETLQVWEDAIFAVRTVKFFRNKNPTANPKLVEFNTNCFRCPEDGKRTGKLVVGLRDAQDGSTKEMRYLKIVFSGADAEEEFLQQIGFGIPTMAL